LVRRMFDDLQRLPGFPVMTLRREVPPRRPPFFFLVFCFRFFFFFFFFLFFFCRRSVSVTFYHNVPELWQTPALFPPTLMDNECCAVFLRAEPVWLHCVCSPSSSTVVFRFGGDFSWLDDFNCTPFTLLSPDCAIGWPKGKGFRDSSVQMFSIVFISVYLFPIFRPVRDWRTGDTPPPAGRQTVARSPAA